MAFIVRLIEGTEPAINLFYSATGWAMLEKGLEPNDPERRELWGGYLEDQLVRQEDGKRVIPLKLQGEFASTDALIDAVNALEERLRHAARFRKDGWGDEVFLEFQLHSSTYLIRYPVCSGAIDKNDLMNACASIMESGHRVTKFMVEMGITVVCENYWEADTNYTLENYIDNPAFWRGAVPGDSWVTIGAPGAVAFDPINVFMGRSLSYTFGAGAADEGCRSDAITVAAATDYYVQARARPGAGCDIVTLQVSDGATLVGFANQNFVMTPANEWHTAGFTFNSGAHATIRVEGIRLAGSAIAGGTCLFDAFYLTPGTTAPVGWSSGRNLTNELDAADQINVLCVAEIPGEVEAEAQLEVQYGAYTTYTQYLSRRTRDDPHNMVGTLRSADAVVTAGDASCLDSALVGDVNAIGGSRVTVTFAGNQTMQKRCYWDIAANLASYYGRWGLIVLTNKSADTDTVTMQMKAQQDIPNFSQGQLYTKTVNLVAAPDWIPQDGWELYSFPVGTHDNDYWGAGDFWRIMVYAAISGGAAWDELWIGGLYLVPLDEAYTVAGGVNLANALARFKNLDGDKGVFLYSAASDSYYGDFGSRGSPMALAPEVENWFQLLNTHNTGRVDITHAKTASVTYRPRGIFLRGSNP